MFAAHAVMLTQHPATATPANIILNGSFASNTVWTGAGSDGKTISGGTANFVSTDAFDGFTQPVVTVAGKYYQLTFTITNSVSAPAFQVFLSGGTLSDATLSGANGTQVMRIQANAGNDLFGFQLEATGTLSVGALSLIGPFTTATVNGS
jgi:hypothetical protein